jgi:uncharacterized protein YxjI
MIMTPDNEELHGRTTYYFTKEIDMRGRRDARQQNRAVRQSSAAAPSAAAAPVSPTSTAALGTRFMMKQRMFSIGQDFWIENDRGQKIFKVDGKAIRVRGTLIFEDAQGRELLQIQERIARVRDTMDIESAAGGTVAKVHNAMVTPLRDRWQIDVPGGQNLSTQGNILHHEYRIERGRQTIATVSKKWFRVRDSYGVEVTPGEDAVKMLAITVVIDMMANAGR